LPLILNNASDLLDLQGKDLGYGQWRKFEDADIEHYRSCTRVTDGCSGNFKGDLPMGLLLATLPKWLDDLLQLKHLKFGVNYGLNDVRMHRSSDAGQFRMSLKVVGTEEPAKDTIRCNHQFSIHDQKQDDAVVTGIFIGQYYL
jgi:hypothetical protein